MKFRKRWLIWIFSISFVLFGTALVVLPPKGFIPVLMYHYVVPKPMAGKTSLLLDVENFRRQMWFLKVFKFRPISLDEFYAIKTGQIKPQGREIVITFDDGDLSYLENALPVLEHDHFPSVNFFVWEFAVKGTEKKMNIEQLKDISLNPLVTIGSHSLSHRNLQTLNPEEARAEIFDSKVKLEQLLNKPVNYFCYPEGSFNEAVAQLVKEAGYRLAFRTSAKHFPRYPATSYYAVPRIKIHSHDGLLAFWFHVSGISNFTRKITVIVPQLTCQLNFFPQLTHNKASDTLNAYEPADKTA